jgi:hypothetical protein
MSKDLIIFRPEILTACEDAFPGNTLDTFNYEDFNIDISELKFEDEIGKGAYGNVQCASYHDQPVAVKIQAIPPDNIQQCTNILIELSTMQSLPHDKLVRYIGAGYRTTSSGIAEVSLDFRYLYIIIAHSCIPLPRF